MLDAVPKLYAPDVSYDRLKTALGLPVAQAGLVATAAGLFGLLALSDKITSTGAMDLAVVLAMGAVAASLIGTNWTHEVAVKPARLDLLSQTLHRSLGPPIWVARAGLVLLLAAIGAALYSTRPASQPAAAQATISSPTITQTFGDSRGFAVTVSWKNLGDTVTTTLTTAPARRYRGAGEERTATEER